jgi:diguanylate cyclase (GGDEF)-like protein
MDPAHRPTRSVPLRALVISLAALAVPVVGALGLAEWLGEYGALLWLTALVPAFLLAYYRRWRGVATALAAGMATLSTTQAAALWLGRDIPGLLLGVVVAYLAIALGIGWIAEVLHRERDEVEDLALTDLLTQLPNRRHARVFLENEFAAARRGRLLAVVLFDLDHFKEYNDEYGHPAGDEALKTFAEVLTRTTRRMNLSARFGGEEFLAILAGSDAEGAVIYAERVRAALRGRNLGDRPLTVSVGVAAFHPSMRSPDELLAAADHSLYQAKREGRNCVRLFGRSTGETDEVSRRMSPPAERPEREEEDYPRASFEMGKSSPPANLLPSHVEGFGAGRSVLLVVEDEQVRELISAYLDREGFSVRSTGDVLSGVRALQDEYDLAITEMRLSGASGTELVAAVKSRWPETQVVVIAGIQDAHITTAERARGRADRYLFKPFGMPELRAHLAEGLARRDRLQSRREERTTLSREAESRAAEARRAVLESVRALAEAVEIRDPTTLGHGQRVSRYGAILADRVDPDGDLLPRDSLELACQLHDVGKIEIPDAILNKTERLNGDEVSQVRRHPVTGRRMLEPILSDELVLSAVSWHHERWDGSGYPDGLAGETIPLVARLVAVADLLDALTSDRPHRPAMPWEKAVERIRAQRDQGLDPTLVDVVEAAGDELRAAFHELHPLQAADARPGRGRAPEAS